MSTRIFRFTIQVGFMAAMFAPISQANACLLGLPCPWYSFVQDHTVTPEFKLQFETMIAHTETIQLTQTTDLHKEFFGNGTSGKSYLRWINQRVYEVGYYQESPADQYYATVNPDWAPNYVFFSFKVAGLPPTKLLAIFLHESMHLDGYPHAYCKKDESGVFVASDSKDDMRACDDNHESSFGLTYTAMCNIHNFCDSCSDSTTAEAAKVAGEALARIVSAEAKTTLTNDCSAK